jgi:predicted Zn-dependent protease with MMP-like domain
MKRMSMQRFGEIVSEVLAALPDEVRHHLANVVVDVEQEPDVETLRQQGFTEEEIAAGDSLYGLFAPIDVTTPWGGDVIDLRDAPHRIIIYKRPLEEDFPDTEELMHEIRKTVLHELHHHFGYSERDISRWTDLE